MKGKFVATVGVGLMSCAALVSCGGGSGGSGESVDSGTQIVLTDPFLDIQGASALSNILRAKVVVNGGSVQAFDILPEQTTISAGIQGVRPNETNTIFVKWFEVLNGFEVEISEQTHSFVSNGVTIIDSVHSTAGYDYDNDGRSNIMERIEGTCVWSESEVCLEQGQADVPDSEQLAAIDVTSIEPSAQTPVNLINDREFNYDGATDLLVNGDFANGIAPWYGEPIFGELFLNGDHLCAVTPASESVNFAHLVFNNVGDLRPGHYSLEFDNNSSTANNFVAVLINIPGPDSVFYTEFFTPAIAGDWGRKQYRFSISPESNYSGSRISFSVFPSLMQPVEFCLNNVSLLIEQ